MLTDIEGENAVHLARNAIESLLQTGKIIDRPDVDLPPVFQEKRGVFVTLTEHGMLRGCIGHPYPDLLLGNAIIDSAISAATHDPRFPPVRGPEMDSIVVEVTVLTQPERIDVPPQRLPDVIEIGIHGLIVKKGYYQGLLLPQVAPENNFDPIDFLNHTCLKAGLPPDAWMTGAEVYWFKGQIYKEDVPRGHVIEETFVNTCQ